MGRRDRPQGGENLGDARERGRLKAGGSWMDLETIRLSEVSQTVEDKHHMPSPIGGILKKKKKSKKERFAEQKRYHGI